VVASRWQSDIFEVTKLKKERESKSRNYFFQRKSFGSQHWCRKQTKLTDSKVYVQQTFFLVMFFGLDKNFKNILGQLNRPYKNIETSLRRQADDADYPYVYTCIYIHTYVCTYTHTGCFLTFPPLGWMSAGWPDELVKKSPKMWPSPCFGNINICLLPCEKVAQTFCALNVTKKLPKRKKSPNERKFAPIWSPWLVRNKWVGCYDMTNVIWQNPFAWRRWQIGVRCYNFEKSFSPKTIWRNDWRLCYSICMLQVKAKYWSASLHFIKKNTNFPGENRRN
jgi:hypothetical protein